MVLLTVPQSKDKKPAGFPTSSRKNTWTEWPGSKKLPWGRGGAAGLDELARATQTAGNIQGLGDLPTLDQLCSEKIQWKGFQAVLCLQHPFMIMQI